MKTGDNDADGVKHGDRDRVEREMESETKRYTEGGGR